MEKIFTPNKYFIGFCALLVVFVAALNYIRDEKILEEARLIGQAQAEWSWPSAGVSVTVGDIKAKILKHTENDAEVEVQGEQKVTRQSSSSSSLSSNQAQPLAGAEPKSTEEKSQFKEVLTLYKNGNSHLWLLGKVEEE